MSIPSALRCGTVLASAIALSACSMMMNPMGTHTPKFRAKLSGAQEVPPNTATAAGVIDAALNKDTQVLRWTLSYSGLSGPVTGAHLHGPAGPGENAGVAVPFHGSLASPIAGEAKLSQAQIDDLLAGKWYVNVHTAAHPGGEIRGQLFPRR